MKYADLQDECIEIVIPDNLKFQEVALLVDRVDFLRPIRAIRIDLDISAPIIDIYEHYPDLALGRWNIEYQKWIEDNHQHGNVRLVSRCRRLLNDLKKPRYMLDYVIQAVLFKCVVDYSGLTRIITKETSFRDTTIAIFPTANTSMTEIEVAWKDTQKWFKNFPQIFRPPKQRLKPKKEFVRDRQWYWRSLRGESYSDIALTEGSIEDQVVYREGRAKGDKNVIVASLEFSEVVNQAIGRYKKMLRL